MTDLIGRTIGDFRLDELIDDEGNASIYRGIKVSTNRAVAVKVLKPEAASNPTAVQAFTQYAQMAAVMAHPNILPVLDSGQAEGLYYLVTPYEGNRSLAQQKSVYSSPAQVSTLFKAMAPGLEYIYSQGMVHGNLRPSNIILDAQRQPLLANIGAAFNQGQAPTAYTSPEQVQGVVVDRRADIFTLGVLLYELLANQVSAPGAALNLHTVRPDLPAQLDHVIQKATAQSPDQRYQTISEFTGALDMALQPAPQPAATPAPAPVPAQTTVQQDVTVEDKGTNWTGILLGALVVIVLCLGVILVGPRLAEYLNQPGDVSQPAPEQPAPEQPAPEQPSGDKSVVIIEKPVIEQPEVEPPAAEQPPAAEPPAAEKPPADVGPEVPALEGAPAQQPGQQICGSLGLAGGIVLLPGIFALRRRKKS
jgi:hypothetical protein